MNSRILPVVLALALVAPALACAADFKVQMKNAGAGGAMVFEPAYTQARVGDTITFVPTDPGHNAELIAGMAPDGISQPPGEIGKAWTLKLAKAGVYGVECAPHFGLGMVALVKAGKGAAPNLAAAGGAKLPPLARARMAPLLAQAK